MQKDISYHSSAVKYNEGLAEAAEKLADEIEHPEVKKWCKSVGKQHRFHAGRHASALEKLQNADASAKDEKTDKDDNKELSVAEQQAQFAAEQERASA